MILMREIVLSLTDRSVIKNGISPVITPLTDSVTGERGTDKGEPNGMNTKANPHSDSVTGERRTDQGD